MRKALLVLLTTMAILVSFSTSLFADPKDRITDASSGQVQTGSYNGVGNIKTINRIYISRAEFVAQLHKELGIKLYYFAAPDVSKVFSDVKSDDKFANQIYDMYSTGIIDDRGYFRPNDKLTREEAVHYIVRAYNYKNNNVHVSEGIGPQHAKPINRGYLKDVSQAQKLGIVGNEKMPAFKKLITRAEALSLIKRVGKLINIQKPVKEVVVKPTYSLNSDGLKMTAQIVNNGRDTVTINFNSGHQIDFMLLDVSNNEIYNSSRGIMFIQALTNVVLKPGESKTYNVELSSSNKNDVIDKVVTMKVKVFGTIDGKEIKEETVRFVRFLGPPVKRSADLGESQNLK